MRRSGLVSCANPHDGVRLSSFLAFPLHPGPRGFLHRPPTKPIGTQPAGKDERRLAPGMQQVPDNHPKREQICLDAATPHFRNHDHHRSLPLPCHTSADMTAERTLGHELFLTQKPKVDRPTGSTKY
eukprot:365816-Chlamydomonas_euryale.AAC.5